MDRARLRHIALYEEALCVVVGSRNPLARRRNIQLADLHALEWIVPTQDSVAYPSVKALFEKGGLTLPRRVIESVSILTNLGLVSSSSMVALMPLSAAQRFAEARMITILPLQGLSPFSDVGYTVRSDRPPSAATQRFLTALREVGQALSPPHRARSS